MGIVLPKKPITLDTGPADAGTPTLIESDIPHIRTTLDEPRREIPMSDTERAELAVLRLQDREGKPVIAVTTRQLTTLITIMTTIASLIFGGGYVGMTSQVETAVDTQVDATVASKVVADVATKHEENRKIVKEELAAVMVTVQARVDKDRDNFSAQLAGVSATIEALDKRMDAQEKATAAQKTAFSAGLAEIKGSQEKATTDILRAISEKGE